MGLHRIRNEVIKRINVIVLAKYMHKINSGNLKSG